MKKSIILSLAALATLAIAPAAAQASTAPTPQWGYSYDGGGWESFDSVVQTPDGGYVGVGDAYILKMDANGTVLWAVNTTSTVRASCVKNVPGGGFVVGGQMGNNAYLAKYDDNGTLLWEQQYVKGSSVNVQTVQVTKDGGFAVAGDANSSTTANDMWLMKTDASGNKLWEQTYGGTDADLVGDYDNSMQQTSDGGYILVGESWTYSQTKYNSDVYVVKTDANGNLKWSKTFGGANTDFGNSVQQTTDGGYIIGGHYEYSSSDRDAYLIKLDSFGNSQWQKTYGGTLSDEAHSVFQTSDGGYAFGGEYSFSSTDFDFYIVKTTSTGAIDWQNAYGGNLGEMEFTMQPTSDGGYVMGGYDESFAQTNRDFYLLKLGYSTALAPNVLGSQSKVQVKSIPAVTGKKALAASFVK